MTAETEAQRLERVATSLYAEFRGSDDHANFSWVLGLARRGLSAAQIADEVYQHCLHFKTAGADVAKLIRDRINEDLPS